MLKRTKGRLLLTLLVITGLAGTLKDNSLTHKERKNAMSLMKETKTDAIKSIKGLSEKQLNFKAAPDRWSVKECMYHLAVTEKRSWDMLEASLKEQADPDKRAEIKITDEQLIKMMEDKDFKIKNATLLEPKNTPYKSLDEAINAFRSRRAAHIKYIKTTTEDLRNHVVQMPFGSLDCYQLCLVMASRSNWYTQQIEEIKADPKFPKK